MPQSKLSLYAATTQLPHIEPALQQEKPPQREACAQQGRVAPPLVSTRESPHIATKTQGSKNKSMRL